MELSKDSILNGDIIIYQPKNGFRVSIDPIILASLVKLKNNQSVLDVGCGIGTISLILKHFNKMLDITSLDIDSTMTDICRKNSATNHLPLHIINQSINSKLQQQFDCIITNPPFYNPNNFRTSSKKLQANFETISLDTWITLCLKRLKSKGDFYIIHIPEQLPIILQNLKSIAGKIEIIPIYSYQNKPAKRVIVKCKKGSREPLKILPGIILHQDNQEYSEELQRILNGKSFQNNLDTI